MTAADTIFALSSGAPPSAIAVVRVSGPDAGMALDRLAGGCPPPRRATLRRVADEDGSIDEALLLWFPAGASATGEPVAEFQLHGGRATIRRLLQALSTIPGFRAARAGEFTRRALANGRLDVGRAEALGDLLAAETEVERRTAMAGLGGALDGTVARWRERLLDVAASVEALIDHDEADDVATRHGEAAVLEEIGALVASLDAAAAGPSSEELRDGLKVVLAGPPNSGKSALLNALAGRDAALVTPHAGTTRDVVEVVVEMSGRAVRLLDTAGLRDTDDAVERLGISRAREVAASADLVLWLGDEPPPEGDHVVALHARCDVPGRGHVDGRIAVSSMTGEGLSRLRSQIVAACEGESTLVLTFRQREALRRSADALRLAADVQDLLFCAAHLRDALYELDVLTGRIATEDLLDRVFARFCIGK